MPHYPNFPSRSHFGIEDGRVPIFWPLPYASTLGVAAGCSCAYSWEPALLVDCRATQRAQYGLIKEYALNDIMDPYRI